MAWCAPVGEQPADVTFLAGIELDRALRRLALAEQRRILDEAATVIRERHTKYESITPALAPLDELPDVGAGWVIVGWVVAMGGTDVRSFPVRWCPETSERRFSRA